MLNTTDRAPARPLARFHLLKLSLLMGLVLGLAAGCAQRETPDQTEDAPAPANVVPNFAGIPQSGNVLGNPYAPVTLVDFSDLRCSHCRDFAEITLPVVIDRYVRSGQVRVVFQNFPILGQPSMQAARMAAAVGLQGHLFEFVDTYYRQPPSVVSDDSLRQLAAGVPGVDPDRALADSKSSTIDSVLDDERNMGHRFSITGTPTVLIGTSDADLHVLSSARATHPDTVTGPIDDLLVHGQR